MIMKTNTLIGAVSILMFSSCAQTKADPKSGPTIYEAVGTNDFGGDTVAAFDMTHSYLLFYDKRFFRGPSLQPTEVGDKINIVKRGDAIAETASGISVPLQEGLLEWSIHPYKCRIIEKSSEASHIMCTDEETGESSKIAYNSQDGVTSFQKRCDSSPQQKCDYRLKSGEGMFSRHMLDSLAKKIAPERVR